MVLKRVRQATIAPTGDRFPRDAASRPGSASAAGGAGGAASAQPSPWLEYKRRRDELSRPAAPEEPWRIRPAGALSFNPPKTAPLKRPFEIRSQRARSAAAAAEAARGDPQYGQVEKRAPAVAFAPPPGASAVTLRKRTRADDLADAAEAHRRAVSSLTQKHPHAANSSPLTSVACRPCAMLWSPALSQPS